LIEQINIIDKSPMDLNLMDHVNDPKKYSAIPYVYDPQEWGRSMSDDMCEDDKFGDIDYDKVYYDENSWERLDPKLVKIGEQEEMSRFKRQEVCAYRTRHEAKNDREGKFVKVKWVRMNKGVQGQPVVRCRLVAQELGYGVKDDELYAGTPALSTMRLFLSWYASTWTENNVIMIMDVKSAFLYGKARRKFLIELPEQDEKSGGDWVGILLMAHATLLELGVSLSTMS